MNSTTQKTFRYIGMIAIFVFGSFFAVQNAYATITNTLDIGSRGPQVTELQTYYAGDISVYPSGFITGYFGLLTEEATRKFQTVQGIVSSGDPITTGYGRVGPRTMARLNELMSSSTPKKTTGSVPNTTFGATPAIVNSRYKDGTYSVDGNYQSPGGAESINVTLVLKNDVVIDATVVMLATRPISMKLQGQFIAGFKQYVIGKNISEVNVGKVSGASLTPKGFNDAVAKIKVQAQS